MDSPDLHDPMKADPFGAQRERCRTNIRVTVGFDPKSRELSTWRDHRDINEVMLATALLEAQVGTARMSDAPPND